MAIISPDVDPQPISGVRVQPAATVDTFGGGPGLEAVDKQVQGIAENVSEIETYEKIRADQMAVQDAQDKLANIHNDLLYNPENGVLRSSGTNALKAQAEGWEKYRKTANEIATSLHNPQQKEAFGKSAVAMGDTFNRTAMVHAQGQLREHDTKTFNSLITNLTDQGAMSYGDPLHRNLLLNTLNDSVIQFARRNGLGQEELDAMKSKIDSNFHGQVISRMLSDKNDLMAQKYFDEVKDNITDANIRENIQKQLEEGSYRGESTRKSDEIWNKTGGNLGDALEKARDIEDPKLRDKTIERLKERSGEVQQARTADQDNAFYEGAQLLGKAQQAGSIIGTQSLEDIVPPATWIRMSPSQQMALKRLYLGGDENSAQVWTSWSLMSPTDKASMSNADFQTNILSHLDNKHRDTAMKQYQDALGNKQIALSDYEQNKLIEDTAKTTGIIPGLNPGKSASKLKGDNGREYEAFQNNIQADVKDFELTVLGGRRRASREETQKIIDKHIVDKLQEKGPSIATSLGRLVGLSDKPAVPFDKIPEDAKIHLSEFARQLGKKVSKEKIEKAYMAYQAKDRKAVAKAFD